MADAEGYKISLESTPTWEVALVCFIIVLISITVDTFLLCVGQLLEKYKEWPLTGALKKIKDAMMAELMLLGFISLLLAVFQTRIGKICMSEQLSNVWLPCKKPDSSSTVANFTTSSFPSGGTRGRRLLAMASNAIDHCGQKGKVAFLSVEAVHHLHNFIFALATFHAALCLLKVLAMIIQWKNLNLYKAVEDVDKELEKLRQSYENRRGFFKSLRVVIVKGMTLMSRDEYRALYVNFVWARPMEDPGRDLRKYTMRILQKEFEKMIGISWYLWLFAAIFLLVNVAGWHALFWISFIPLILWLIVHFKLENMIGQLAKDVVKKQTVVDISDDNFLLGRPRLVGILIHFMLFENSLQLTFFFFILFQFGFHSCMMGKVGFVVPRIAIGMLVQVWCTYRTLPLYAIMKSQMYLKENQLDEQNIEEEMQIVTWISKWIDKRKKPSSTEEATNIESTQTGSREGSVGVEITESGDVNSTGDIEAPIDNQARTNTENK